MKKMLKALPLALAMVASFSAQALMPGSGTWVKETATYGTPNLRDTYIYVPKNAAPQALEGKRAAMLIMSGCMQTASAVINNGYGYEATAEKYGMVLIAPTAPDIGTTYPSGSPGNCWDSIGFDYSRTTRNAVPLKKLMDSVINRSTLEIDSRQVYVTGFSGGAAMTTILACTFPDVFAGFGAHAGITWGTTLADIKKYPVPAPVPTPEQIANACRVANGNLYNEFFNKQIGGFSYGTSDTSVPPAHNVRNMQGMAQVYNMALTPSADTAIPGNGTLRTYKDAAGNERFQEIAVKGLAHQWWTSSPATLTDWLFKNNLRLKNDPCASATVSPSEIVFPASGGSQTVTVTADPQCKWTAESGGQQLGSGSGNGSFNFHMDSFYIVGDIKGVIKVAGKQIPVTLQGVCAFSVTPTSVEMPATGGTASYTLQWVRGAGRDYPAEYCNYGPRSSDAWVTASIGTPGPTMQGSITVAANSGSAARTGSVYVGGNTITIKQAAGTPPPPCYTDVNYKHVTAKRASYRYTPSFGVVAKGSNTDLGAYTKTTSLKMTKPDYYELVNSCQ